MNVKSIKPYEATSNSFEILFDQMYLMEREDIRKTLVEHQKFIPKEKGD